MPNDDTSPVPGAAPTGEDADTELFYELLAEQRY